MSSKKLEFQTMKLYISCKTVLSFPSLSPHWLSARNYNFILYLGKCDWRKIYPIEEGVLLIAYIYLCLPPFLIGRVRVKWCSACTDNLCISKFLQEKAPKSKNIARYVLWCTINLMRSRIKKKMYRIRKQ